ncbi:hypothetical protein DYI37_05000 [Fulvimarina endophytica]|uniref:DUF5330 domain-containing protein n=1 Tax=Fulvimarina endophytica TaxID=2293836 RepID=A0A371X7M1_9HYPH|nr:DUF5330 domain-containing protein [Fulvimarina endophytica]RFC65206.1 hypothetical protein DYI37_05000 [Fulvimarina endophytica]
MIRFALKTVLALWAVSLVLPASGPDDEAQPFDAFQSLAGLRAAVEDVAGFCSRAPEACEAGARLSAFAREQVESGLALALASSAPSPSHPASAEPGIASSPKPDDRPLDGARDTTDWNGIDAGLLAALYASGGEDDVKALAASPEVVAAVRAAARLATRGAGPESAPVEPFVEALPVAAANPAVAAGAELGPGVARVPIPSPRPGL